MGGMDRWDPWRALHATDIDLTYAELDGERGRWTRSEQGDTIALHPLLDPRSAREVLAHELVHAERGVGWPAASASTMEIEEERVWRTALRRLAPPEEVARFLAERGALGAVTVADLADEFELSPRAAARVAALWAVGALSPSDGHDP